MGLKTMQLIPGDSSGCPPRLLELIAVRLWDWRRSVTCGWPGWSPTKEVARGAVWFLGATRSAVLVQMIFPPEAPFSPESNGAYARRFRGSSQNPKIRKGVQAFMSMCSSRLKPLLAVSCTIVVPHCVSTLFVFHTLKLFWSDLQRFCVGGGPC